MRFNVLDILGGLTGGDLLKNVLHFATPQLSRPLFAELLHKAGDAGLEKLGRLLVMAGEACIAHDRPAAAGNLARFIGEIKW